VQGCRGTSRDANGIRARCFVTRQDTAPTPPNLLRALRAACRAAGIPELRVHDLRHMHATLALRGRADLKTLQRRLGHSSLSMTLGLYAHAVAAGNEQAALAVERMLDRPT
jgi:integrase